MTVRQRRLLMTLVIAGTVGVSAIAASSASAIHQGVAERPGGVL